MTAALIVLSVFFGIALCVGTVAAAILLANGKITLPRTSMRRLQRAQVELKLMEIRLEQERVQMTMDAQIDLRLQRAAIPIGREIDNE